MKFIDKINPLKKDPAFQIRRRNLKAMAYIAKHNKSTNLTLHPIHFYVKVSGDTHGPEYKTRYVDGWCLSLINNKTQKTIQQLDMMPLEEYKL